MKQIQTSALLEFFSKEGYQYNIKQEATVSLLETYTIASLFSPIKKGVYFFKGEKLPPEIKQSLILINDLPKQAADSSNVFIVMKEDVQLVYYKFLRYIFPQSSNGIIAPTAIIHPNAKIGENVEIGHYSIIEECEIADNVKIGNHCKIHSGTKIGKNTTIEDFSDIGTRGIAWIWDEKNNEKIVQPQLGGVEIGENCIFASNTIIVRGSLNENTKIGNNTFFAPGCRIGHGTQIGTFVHFANNIITGGNVRIGDNSFVGSSAVFRAKVKIDKNTIVGAGAVVIKNTSASNLTLMGIPAKEYQTKERPSAMPKPKKI